MTAFLKGKAVSQFDEMLINGKRFHQEQLKEILKDIEPKKPTKKKK